MDKKRGTDQVEVERFASYGMAAMLPGMQLAVDFMAAKLNEMRSQLAAMQQNGHAVALPGEGFKPKRTHRISPEGAAAISAAQKRRWAKAKGKRSNSPEPEPAPAPAPAAKAKATNNGATNYWARMTPRQRKNEMKRRGMLRDKDKAKSAKSAKKPAPAVKLAKVPTHPRDPKHPGHEQYLKNLRAGVKRRFAGMTPEARKELAKPMMAARAAVA